MWLRAFHTAVARHGHSTVASGVGLRLPRKLLAERQAAEVAYDKRCTAIWNDCKKWELPYPADVLKGWHDRTWSNISVIQPQPVEHQSFEAGWGDFMEVRSHWADKDKDTVLYDREVTVCEEEAVFLGQQFTFGPLSEEEYSYWRGWLQLPDEAPAIDPKRRQELAQRLGLKEEELQYGFHVQRIL